MPLHLEEVRTIGLVAVNLGLGEITEAEAEAYVVPQFAKSVSTGGLAA